MAGHRVDAVLTGHIGRQAAAALEAAGVKIFLGASGPVNSALEAFAAGRLEEKV